MQKKHLKGMYYNTLIKQTTFTQGHQKHHHNSNYSKESDNEVHFSLNPMLLQDKMIILQGSQPTTSTTKSITKSAFMLMMFSSKTPIHDSTSFVIILNLFYWVIWIIQIRINAKLLNGRFGISISAHLFQSTSLFIYSTNFILTLYHLK